MLLFIDARGIGGVGDIEHDGDIWHEAVGNHACAAPLNNNRAGNALVEVQHLGGIKKLHLALKSPKPAEGLFWIDLGEYDCGNDTAITISNADANGYVVVNGVRWLSVED